ncbi:hypothetical protein KFK09_015331 [Dendrobium nobile]|uniref:Uncharacterized protein n=1 Tax=Dendrobium nobile TaxID=94219 RepID=A0A8T3B6G1_DENNO|nr:hypothetical protein KFK09_015331 [Dendrobium nobile]
MDEKENYIEFRASVKSDSSPLKSLSPIIDGSGGKRRRMDWTRGQYLFLVDIDLNFWFRTILFVEEFKISEVLRLHESLIRYFVVVRLRYFVVVRLRSFDDVSFPSDRTLQHFDLKQRRELPLARCEDAGLLMFAWFENAFKLWNGWCNKSYGGLKDWGVVSVFLE